MKLLNGQMVPAQSGLVAGGSALGRIGPLGDFGELITCRGGVPLWELSLVATTV